MKARSFLAALVLPLAALWVVRDRFVGLWSHSVDLGLHRFKVSRIVDLGIFSSTDDPVLGPALSAYPRWAHIPAAELGKLAGSSLIGIHVVALSALAFIWGCFGLGLSSLPRRAMYAAFASVMLALVANARWIGLEIHGCEMVDNYFFSHLVSQSAVIGLIVVAVWLERLGVAAYRVYLVLGVGVLVADNLHFTPAVVLLGLLALLVVADFLAFPVGRRRRATAGALVVLAAIVLTLIDPSFRMIIGTAQNNGYLGLRYVGNVKVLAELCLLVAALSATTFAFWFRHARDEGGKTRLLLKYLGLYGLASALLCGLQIGMLALGSGSEYACRKYAIAMNTALLLELALLPVALVKRWWRAEPSYRLFAAPVLSGVLLVLAMRLILPDATARDFRRLLRDEQAILALTRTHEFGHGEEKLDYVVGLGDRSHDFLFNISRPSHLGYQYSGLIELLQGRPFSRPELVGRLASREGSPWDMPACRLRPPLDGLVVLNATCVLSARARQGVN